MQSRRKQSLWFSTDDEMDREDKANEAYCLRLRYPCADVLKAVETGAVLIKKISNLANLTYCQVGFASSASSTRCAVRFSNFGGCLILSLLYSSI